VYNYEYPEMTTSFGVACHAGLSEEDAMPLLRNPRHRPAQDTPPDTAAPVVESAPRSPVPEKRAVPSTRTSVAWLGVWTATVLLVGFIVFILQNTRSVEVSFLWLHGTLPLAVGLLIATVAGVVVTLVLGTARITQLHRLARRRSRLSAAAENLARPARTSDPAPTEKDRS
jgi:uncharacterized integral membrane protein